MVLDMILTRKDRAAATWRARARTEVWLFPVLATLRFGGRSLGVNSYGVLLAVGLACGVAFAYREGKRQQLDGGRVLDLAFWLTSSGSSARGWPISS